MLFSIQNQQTHLGVGEEEEEGGWGMQVAAIGGCQLVGLRNIHNICGS